MDIQKINDFAHILNKDTVYAAMKNGYDIRGFEIWEMFADKVVANWKIRLQENGNVMMIVEGHGDNRVPVKLTQELIDALPYRLSNFRNLEAEFLLVDYLKELGIGVRCGTPKEDSKGIDIHVQDALGFWAKVAVFKESGRDAYIRKYPIPKCHHEFTFDELEDITKDSVLKWYCGKFF